MSVDTAAQPEAAKSRFTLPSAYTILFALIVLAAIVMFLLFLPLSFLIPSSSGLATVAMPIMAPLARFVDVPEELVVTAYQSASGLMNLFIPTSAVVMGGLAIARVPYDRYLRWVWPLLAALGVLCVIVLGVSAALS
jgi:uncharacterized ion transporter superfamily protein YfcC